MKGFFSSLIMASIDRFIRKTQSGQTVYFTRGHLLNTTKTPGYVLNTREVANATHQRSLWLTSTLVVVMGLIIALTVLNGSSGETVAVILAVWFIYLGLQYRSWRKFENAHEIYDPAKHGDLIQTAKETE